MTVPSQHYFNYAEYYFDMERIVTARSTLMSYVGICVIASWNTKFNFCYCFVSRFGR
jgi:hypothetical protein